MILEKNPNIDKQALVKESYVSFPFNNYYPDNLILNSIQISQFNKNIFLANNDYSNMELNLYYKNIFNHKNWEVYYRDLSQDNNIKAIKCYINNVDILNVINDYKTLSNDLKSVQWEILLDWELLFEEYLNTKKINNELLDTILKKKQLMLTNSSFNSILKAFFTDFFNIPNNNIDFEEFNFDRFLQDFINQNWSSMIHEQYNDLKTLKFYLPLIQSNNYTKDEILKISEFYGIKYSDNDLQNYNNINYLIE